MNSTANPPLKRIFVGLFLGISLNISAASFGAPSAMNLQSGPSDTKRIREQIAGLERFVNQTKDPTSTMYLLAVLNTRVGEKAEVLRWLRNLARADVGYDIMGAREFESFWNDTDFRQLADKMRSRIPAINRSVLALNINERDLIPEGLAVDPNTGDLYLSSLNKRKIVKIDSSGSVQDFVVSGQDNIGETLGMKVDPKTHTLWVCSAEEHGARAGWSGIFRYDLNSKRLIKSYVLPGSEPHLFNDLVVLSNGDVYLTDSVAGSVFTISRGEEKLKPVAGLTSLRYPNGIAVSDNNRKLYVAHFSGTTVYDLRTQRAIALEHPKSVTLAVIDGLYFYKDSLIAIQHLGAPRIVRFSLDAQLERVQHAEILENSSDFFDLPTTGAIRGNQFYFIANSQIRSLRDGKVADPEKLKPVYIVKLKLRSVQRRS